MNRRMSDAFLTLVCGGLAIIAMLFVAGYYSPVDAQSKGSVSVSTLADITGDGSAHALASSVTTARWVVVLAPTANTANLRVGDAATGNAQGASVLPGGSFMFPAVPNAPGMKNADQYYDLSTIYYYAAVGDKVSVVWGK